MSELRPGDEVVIKSRWHWNTPAVYRNAIVKRVTPKLVYIEKGADGLYGSQYPREDVARWTPRLMKALDEALQRATDLEQQAEAVRKEAEAIFEAER